MIKNALLEGAAFHRGLALPRGEKREYFSPGGEILAVRKREKRKVWLGTLQESQHCSGFDSPNPGNEQTQGLP